MGATLTTVTLSLLAVSACAPGTERSAESPFGPVASAAARGLRFALEVTGRAANREKEERCGRLLTRDYGVVLDASAPVRVRLRLDDPNQLTILHGQWSVYNQPRDAWVMEHLCSDALAVVIRLLPELERRSAAAASARLPTAPVEPMPPEAMTRTAPAPTAPEATVAPAPPRAAEPLGPAPGPRALPPGSPSVARTAEEHAALGRALYARGQLRPAAIEFLIAYDIADAPAYLFSAAYCLHQLGRQLRGADELRAARTLYDHFRAAQPGSAWSSAYDEVAHDLDELDAAP